MEPNETPQPFAVVFESSDQSAVALAESILRDAGIPSIQQEEGPVGTPWDGVRTFGLGLHLLMVSQRDAEDARALLADLARPADSEDIEAGEIDQPEMADQRSLPAAPRGQLTVRRYLALVVLLLVALIFLAMLWRFVREGV